PPSTTPTAALRPRPPAERRPAAAGASLPDPNASRGARADAGTAPTGGQPSAGGPEKEGRIHLAVPLPTDVAPKPGSRPDSRERRNPGALLAGSEGSGAGLTLAPSPAQARSAVVFGVSAAL